ncbi:MAG: sodium:proton exchanger [Oscillospiraceae bacterium]|nr:sodium:proton exchanger [Oscillospiraceae bacterium]MBQ7816038.1 sodium:proton exchanger [Oscillospiraceae bacterium]
MEVTTYYGILSLIPIIVTIGLVLWTKNVLVSLFAGVFSGALIICNYAPMEALKATIGDYIIPRLMDSYNAGIMVLLVFIGGFVTLLEKSGGAQSFAAAVAKFVDTRCKTQLAAWLGGIIIFFSELGTPMIVGPIFNPSFRKMRISKEKMAWILDTTSSPVCVLLPFFGWGATVMGILAVEFEALGITNLTDWSAFCQAIPYQIYPILCLIMVPLVAFTGKEFSAMAKAEKDARKGIFSPAPGEENVKPVVIDTKVSPLVVIIPLIVMLTVFFANLVPLGFPTKAVPGGKMRIALISAYLLAAITMIVLMKFYKVMSINEGVKTYIKGCSKLFDCIVLLTLAWALSTVDGALGTSEFIVQIARDTIPVWTVPAIIFIIAAIMSFATGTSWGTYAIVLPIAVPMAHHLGVDMIVTIGAVLSGGLFGDHCSPVSDTTILSSIGAECELMNHTWTQLPYALLVAAVSLVGFVVSAFVKTPIISVLCAVVLVVVYIIVANAKGVTIENLSLADIEKIESEE